MKIQGVNDYKPCDTSQETEFTNIGSIFQVWAETCIFNVIFQIGFKDQES